MQKRVNEFQKKYGVNIEDQIKAILDLGSREDLESKEVVINGSSFSYIHEVFGFFSASNFNDIESRYELYKNRIGEYYLPIASDPGGNIYCVSLLERERGYVYFWDHELEDSNDAFTFLSTSIDSFVNSLQDKPTDTIEKILKEDDVESLKALSSDRRFFLDYRTELGSSLLRLAVIQAAPKCIQFLHELGCQGDDLLIIAKRNTQFFPKYIPIVELLKKLGY